MSQVKTAPLPTVSLFYHARRLFTLILNLWDLLFFYFSKYRKAFTPSFFLYRQSVLFIIQFRIIDDTMRGGGLRFKDFKPPIYVLKNIYTQLGERDKCSSCDFYEVMILKFQLRMHMFSFQ